MNEARWNSRASFFFMSWFLLPERRNSLLNVVKFLDEVWCPNWFAARERKVDFRQISENVDDEMLKQFFNKNDVASIPPLDVPLTNEIAERSLGRLTQMNMPRILKRDVSRQELLNPQKAQILNNARRFERQFLSFVNNI